MACAVLSRSFYKTNTAVPADCQDCFKRYCWDGTRNSTTPAGNYTPPYKIGEVAIKSEGLRMAQMMNWMVMGTIGAMFLLV